MSETALVQAPRRSAAMVEGAPNFSREQVELIKRTIARGATDDELALFMSTSERLRLDPFARQIFSVARYDVEVGGYVRQTQVSIDGLRLVAERTGRYRPADELPEFKYNGKGELLAATVFVWKLYDTTWFKCPAIAFFDEYAGRKKGGELTRMWAEKQHVMLAKCAEALAIRKAFPHETSGAYVPEEMDGDNVIDVTPPPPQQERRAPPPAAGPKPNSPEDIGYVKPQPAASAPPRAAEGPSEKAQAMLEDEERRQGKREKGTKSKPAAAAEPNEGPPPPSPLAREPAAAAGPSTSTSRDQQIAKETAAADVYFSDKPLPVDELVAVTLSAKTIAEYKQAWAKFKTLTKAEKDIAIPELVKCLLRILQTGPDGDVVEAWEALGRYNEAGMCTPAEWTSAQHAYAKRTGEVKAQ